MFAALPKGQNSYIAEYGELRSCTSIRDYYIINLIADIKTELYVEKFKEPICRLYFPTEHGLRFVSKRLCHEKFITKWSLVSKNNLVAETVVCENR